MSQKTTVGQPHSVQQNDSTGTLSCALAQQHRERKAYGRVAATDLRIGLNLLGKNGRMLLAEFIKTRSQ